jgi:coproporphyrinogen III oxidase-like Fe-S oxidoreductase
VSAENSKTMDLVLPEAENRSLIIHGPGVCPYAKCSYCPLFSEGRSKSFDIKEFQGHIRGEAVRFPPEEITSIFISEGNTMSMEPRILNAILKALYANFPFLERVSVYGSAQAILNRSVRQMEIFLKRGLTRIHMGLESGSDRILSILNKGVDRRGMLEAAGRVKNSGIELYVNVLIGAGGTALSAEHLEASASAINTVNPDSVELHTLVPIKGTPLFDRSAQGQFEFLSPHDSIREIRALISTIEVPVRFTCAHYSNHCQINGRLPGDRQRFLKELDYSLSIDESLFDTTGIVNIGLPKE